MNQAYLTCHIKVNISHIINLTDLYNRLSLSTIKTVRYVGTKKTITKLRFVYNEYLVMIENSYVLLKNRFISIILKVDNILLLINNVMRLIKYPGFITQYEYLTKLEIRGYNSYFNRIVDKSIDVTMLTILTILSHQSNSIFHYMPFDIIHVISTIL